MRVYFIAFFILTMMASSACVSLQSVSLTQVPAQRANKVRAESSKFMFLLISFDNDYVDEAVHKLKSQCEGGQITGILTKDEFVNYFLGIFSKRRVIAEGYCSK